MTGCLATLVFDPPVFVALAIWAGILLLLLWVRAQRFFFGKPYFLLTCAGMLVWLGAAALELAATALPCKIAFAAAAWPGIGLLPTAWAFFLSDYAFSRSRPIRGPTFAALCLGPAAVGAAALSNPLHGLFYGPATRLALVDGRPSAVFDHGPLFYAAAAYLYLYMVAAVAITLVGAFRAHRAYRSFFLLMLFITAVPLAGNAGYVAFGFTILGFDPTPFLFSFVLFVFTALIFTNRIFDIATIGKDMLFYDTRNPVVIVAQDGRVAAANGAALAAFGAGPAAVGGPLAEWPAIGPAVAPRLAARAADGAAVPLAAGGRQFDLRVLPLAAPLGRGGPALGWVLHALDLTGQRALEAQLSAERDTLATLTETSISGIMALDLAGVIVLANPEACRILGRDPSDIVGRRFDDPAWGIGALDGGGFARDELPVARALADGGPVRDSRFSIRWPDGTRRAIAVNAALTDGRAGPQRIVCTVADITDQLATEAALREAAERAEAASRTKSRFVANMSHEIRTPLNGVLGMAELLDARVTDPEQKAMLATIRDSGALLLSILNDVLDVSKIEAGKLALEAIPFVPAAVLDRVAALYRPRAAEKGLDFRIAAGTGADAPRTGDPMRVAQVLHNLVSNAVKFTETGSVAVTLTAEGAGPLVLTVADTGIGMTAAEQAVLYQDFEQADGSVTRRFGGTGLGMPIARRLVEMMGGTIAVESAKGHGTTVRVTLPLPPAAAPAAAPAASDPLPPVAGLTVLAADDSAANRSVLRAMLASLGVEAVIAEDGAGAVAAWAPGRFDALLLDISMPGMDGTAALAAIRAAAAAAGAPRPHAVAITANALAHQVEAFHAAGFDAHLPKPFRRADLAAALAAVRR